MIKLLWREQVTFNVMMMMSASHYTKTLNMIFVVLVHWNSSQWVDMSLHSVTLSRTMFQLWHICLSMQKLFLGQIWILKNCLLENVDSQNGRPPTKKNAYCKKLIRLKISYLYSQICNERSPLEQKSGLLRKVIYWKRLNLSEIVCEKTRKPFNTGDCLIGVIS